MCCCFCCCETRKSILIYIIVVSVIAFIYGIVAMSNFGSNTTLYKNLISKIKTLEMSPLTSDTYDDDYYRRTYDNYPYNNNYDYNNYQTSSDFESEQKIQSLTYSYIKTHKYKNIKRLKGTEKGLGVILFIFQIIFLAAAIIYLIFVCGTRETQILPTKTYNIFYIVKIIVYALAIVFIFLALLYGNLLCLILVEYVNFMDNIDTCAARIVIQMIYGCYCFYYYIIVSCGFGKERQLFYEVGEVNRIGPKAQYDLNGNVIVRTVVVTTGVNPQYGLNPQIGGLVPLTGVNPQFIGQNMNNQMYQQVNQPPNQNPIEVNEQNQTQLENNLNDKTDKNLNNGKSIEQSSLNKLNKQ